MKSVSSTHEYNIQMTEADRLCLLDQLAMARYYIEALNNDTTENQLKNNDKLTQFLSNLWK